MASSVMSTAVTVSAVVANHAACSCQSPPFNSQLLGIFRASNPLMCCRALVRSTLTGIAMLGRLSVSVILPLHSCSAWRRSSTVCPRLAFVHSLLQPNAVLFISSVGPRWRPWLAGSRCSVHQRGGGLPLCDLVSGAVVPATIRRPLFLWKYMACLLPPPR